MNATLSDFQRGRFYLLTRGEGQDILIVGKGAGLYAEIALEVAAPKLAEHIAVLEDESRPAASFEWTSREHLMMGLSEKEKAPPSSEGEPAYCGCGYPVSRDTPHHCQDR